VDLHEAATRLIVVVSGEMTVCVENLAGGNVMDACKFKVGDFIGDFALLSDTVRAWERVRSILKFAMYIYRMIK